MSGQNTSPRLDSRSRGLYGFIHSVGGASALEFAIIGPVFIVLLLGIMCYGGYFWLAHSVQQLANDSARSAVAGLTAAERQQLAQSAFNVEVQNYSIIKPSSAVVSVDSSQTDAMTVSVAYDASGMPFWIFGSLVPMPPSTITRAATIKLAGY